MQAHLEITTLHMIIMLTTVAAVIGGGIYAAGSVKSAEGYSLGGRSAGVPMVAGSIAGTIIGGGATVGTAQLAYSAGLSAWWFTLGSGLTFIIMGLFYAGPLRKTGLETIPQYFVLHYGKKAGSIASVVSSLGIFFSAVASCLPGIALISAVFAISPGESACFLVTLVACYVFFGGMKSAGVSGILKMTVIFFSLFLAGGAAFWSLYTDPSIFASLPFSPWFDPLGNGGVNALEKFLSLLVGIICTQTYIQTIFSASDPKTAAYGTFAAALVVIPVGLPCSMIGVYMHALHPGVSPILVLPLYLLQHQPVWLGSVAMGGIFLSLIGSIGGLSLGIGTMVSKDILSPWLKIKSNRGLLRLNRLVVLGVMFCACGFALLHQDSQILFWNYLSMALRGGGIFLPLSLAIFCPGRVGARRAVLSMLLSTGVALAATFAGTSIKPLFLGLAVSAVVLLPGLLRKYSYEVEKG